MMTTRKRPVLLAKLTDAERGALQVLRMAVFTWVKDSPDGTMFVIALGGYRIDSDAAIRLVSLGLAEKRGLAHGGWEDWRGKEYRITPDGAAALEKWAANIRRKEMGS